MSSLKRKQRSTRIVRVRRRSNKTSSSHGAQAWKLAFADFMTAMMLVFMALWLANTNDGAKQSIEGYFQDPVGFLKGTAAGSAAISLGTPPAGSMAGQDRTLAREREQGLLEMVRERIRLRLLEHGLSDELEGLIELTLTDDGLRIELIEMGQGETFFELGSATPKPIAQRTLSLVAPELQDLPNDIVIEGHTDALPYSSDGYTNWELSTDRANAARRTLSQHGVSPGRIVEVRGYADTQPRAANDRTAPSNRRVSILVRYQEAEPSFSAPSV